MSKYIELTNAYLYSFLLRIDINHKAWVDTFFLCRLFFLYLYNKYKYALKSEYYLITIKALILLNIFFFLLNDFIIV